MWSAVTGLILCLIGVLVFKLWEQRQGPPQQQFGLAESKAAEEAGKGYHPSHHGSEVDVTHLLMEADDDDDAITGNEYTMDMSAGGIGRGYAVEQSTMPIPIHALPSDAALLDPRFAQQAAPTSFGRGAVAAGSFLPSSLSYNIQGSMGASYRASYTNAAGAGSGLLHAPRRAQGVERGLSLARR